MTFRRPLSRSLLFGLIALLACPHAHEVEACAVVRLRGESVERADEAAIIVWDAATKTQHFIRRASFHTSAADFGFLVPTPTRPVLAEAAESAIGLLAKVTEPRTIERAVSRYQLGCGGPPRGGFSAGKVNVLELKRVAGYDAAVLESDNAEALIRWLQDHNYDYSPALKEWLEPYVAAKWKVTAFKVARYDADDPKTATSAVRMSFRTERPFYPYREPEADAEAKASSAKRLLRVFFVGDARVAGTLGEAGPQWPGDAVWSNRLDAEVRTKLLEALQLPESAAPAEAVLTEFEDRSSIRPGANDVFFSPSEDRGTVERPPNFVVVERFWHADTAEAGLVVLAPLLLLLMGSIWGIVRLVRFARRMWGNAGKAAETG